MSIKKICNRDFELQYKLVSEIGVGANSVVHECRSLQTTRDTSRFAVKISEKSSVDYGMLEDEFKIIAKLDHENITKGIEMLVSSDKVYTVVELVDGGELHSLINVEGNFSENDAAVICHQLLKAVFYIHENNICHRDIKPENILLCSDGTVKLADFGLAVELESSDELMRECVGTQAYQAPEVLAPMPYSKIVTIL
eukprot:TRINITY_DN1065_c4_g1_i1.p1 TRINITY_DN1065_c4_g1~~TRINITY_DN1065_c4_g1_i1.p1  ORF type:complete len:197 (-),score=33.28 TRINITY_DN1065_c4_g1_i1:85-675(-)